MLKLLAGRSQEITDLFAIATEPDRTDEIREKLRSYETSAERTHLARVRDRIDRREEYVDALPRRGLGFPKLPRNIRSWTNFRSIVDELVSAADV